MSLQRHLKFNDNAASTTVVATVGSNATLNGGDNTSAKQISGPGGSITYAFDLNGADDYVTLGAADVYDIPHGSAFTISMWINSDAISGSHALGREGSNFRGIQITSSTNIRISTSDGDFDYTVPTLSNGTWYHIFVTRNTSNSCRVWVNGVESSTGAQSATSFFTFDSVGRRSSNYFDGRISEFRYFDNDESANVATYYAEGVSSGGGGGGGSTSTIQNIGSMISIMIPGRQWLAYPNTVSTGELYSLVGLYDSYSSSGGSGSESGSSIVLDGVGSITTYAFGEMSLANRLSAFDLTYTYGLGSITVVGTGGILGTLFSTQTIQYNYSPYLTNATGYTGGIEQLGNIVVHGGLRVPYIRDMNKNVTILSDTMQYRFRNDEKLAISGVISNISSGYRFVLNVRNENNQPINLTTLSGTTALFTKPDSTVIRSATSYVTDGTDGSVYTITSGNQFSTNGRWYLQLQTTGNGAIYTSKKYRFKVG